MQTADLKPSEHVARTVHCPTRSPRSQVVCFAILEFLLFAGVFAIQARAQDTRDVSEPKIPPICQRLSARLKGESGAPREDSQTVLDTARIQSAIDRCQSGQAVALQTSGANDSFLSGPLELKPAVTLLVERGAVLFGTRNPRAYDVQPGSCGVVNDDGRGCRPLLHAAHAQEDARSPHQQRAAAFR